MAEHGVCYLPEGSSFSAPPMFDGENFIYWQMRMKTFIKASEYGLWDVFQHGNYIPTKEVNGQRISKCRSELNNDDKQQIMLNDKAINILLCAITEKEYLQISNLETAQEMWKALEIAHGKSIEEASSAGECSSEEKAKICLVADGEEANTDSDNSDNEVYVSDPTYDELLSEYNSMHTEFERLAKELICAKKKIKSLEEKLKETPEAMHKCVKCMESENESIKLKKTLEKFTHGSEMLSVLKGNQGHVPDKSGINKDPISERKKRKRKEKSSNHFNSSIYAHCFYCNRVGHVIASCYYKKKGTHGTFKWVPKGTYVPKAKSTNRSGPERQRVPKYPPNSISFQDISRNGQIDRRILKRRNHKINQRRARETIPQTSKIIQKRNRWRQHMDWTSMSYHVGAVQKKACASTIDHHRVPFCYQKRRKRNWVW